MLKEFCNNKYGRDLSACSNEEIYVALLEMTKELSKNRVSEEGKNLCVWKKGSWVQQWWVYFLD